METDLLNCCLDQWWGFFTFPAELREALGGKVCKRPEMFSTFGWKGLRETKCCWVETGKVCERRTSCDRDQPPPAPLHSANRLQQPPNTKPHNQTTQSNHTTKPHNQRTKANHTVKPYGQTTNHTVLQLNFSAFLQFDQTSSFSTEPTANQLNCIQEKR